MITEEIPESLDVLFNGLEDPRLDRNKLYSLSEILFLTLVAVVCGVDSWRGVELLGNNRLEFLRQYFSYKNGIPSHQTIGRVFSLIKPKAFEICFINFMKYMCNLSGEEIIALDGKTLRRSHDRANGIPALHMVNAWAVNNGVSLGQLKVDDKSNEITAVPELLDLLDVKGSIVTADALNCQKEIAEKVKKNKGDYVLAVKGNQGTLHEEIAYEFKVALEEKQLNPYETVEKGHGRVETRRYSCLQVGEWLGRRNEWEGLQSVGMVETEVYRGENLTTEKRYFILSIPPDVQKFARACRGHWGIENSLHWVLDVTFGEDASRIRKDHAPRNFAIIRKLALNIIKTDKESKISLRLRKAQAMMTPEYLKKLLRQAGFK